MAERLILDTSVLISAERGHLDLAAAAGDDADAALPAIVLAEYLTGVHLAATDTQRAARHEFLDRVLQVLPIETYTHRVAERHAELLAHAHRSGTTRGAHDLIIAATALATGRTVLTTDTRAGFDQLPGVSARVHAQ
ncbi:MAG: PIN domain-containing protein [Jatrophihabitans sp.]